MLKQESHHRPLPDRGPLRVLFVITSMPVGGAETLLVNLMRRFESDRIQPELCCLKERGPLGETIALEFPTHSDLLHSKWDFRVLGRLRALIRDRRIDAVLTVGAGDKMFWGRLAGWRERLPVILSALHSTGWPDTVGRLNHFLTPLTDGFIAVAPQHGEYLVEVERFPRDRVHVIPNGVDIQRFRPRPDQRSAVRKGLGLSEGAPVCGIVAALRPEKNHTLFLEAATLVHHEMPDAHFVVVGDGPERQRLEETARTRGLVECTHFLGSRDDVAELLAAMDVFSLTSHMEANPVSIMEALATEVPVVATRVGSVATTVRHGATGYLAQPGNAEEIARFWIDLLKNPQRAAEMGQVGRKLVMRTASLERMVEGYERLICDIYARKYPGAMAAHSHQPAAIES